MDRRYFAHICGLTRNFDFVFWEFFLRKLSRGHLFTTELLGTSCRAMHELLYARAFLDGHLIRTDGELVGDTEDYPYC